MKHITVLGSGDVGKTVAAGYRKHGYEVLIASRSPEKLKDWAKENDVSTGTFQEGAAFADVIFLLVKGAAAMDCLKAVGVDALKDKIVVDGTNPIADKPPVNGLLQFYKLDGYNSQMEALQAEYPSAKFVKAFNSIGYPLMIDPTLEEGKPTMMICGNDAGAKGTVAGLCEEVGHAVEDMGGAAIAGPIESLCLLWCSRGLNFGKWNHAFKLITK